MLSDLGKSTSVNNMHSSVQPVNNHEPEVPVGAFLFDSLKPLELQLQLREILPLSTSSQFNPLWFIAETERNIFLWRSGLSLAQADDFEFWIDLPALINKRLKQLELNDSANPFMNPVWGTGQNNEAMIEREICYLSQFAEVIKKIELHASALSQITSILKREMSPTLTKPRMVILP